MSTHINKREIGICGQNRVNLQLPPAVAIVKTPNQMRLYYDWGADQDTPGALSTQTLPQPKFKPNGGQDFKTVEILLEKAKPVVYIGGEDDNNAIWLTDYEAAMQIASRASHVSLQNNEYVPGARPVFLSCQIVFLVGV